MLSYSNLVEELLNAIPEIRPLYEKELDWWDEVLPHVVLGDILNPYLIELLGKDKEEQLIRRIFKFLEEMALSPDEFVQEVLAVTVAARLGDDPAILDKAKKYMDTRTKKISEDIEKGLGRSQ